MFFIHSQSNFATHVFCVFFSTRSLFSYWSNTRILCFLQHTQFVFLLVQHTYVYVFQRGRVQIGVVRLKFKYLNFVDFWRFVKEIHLTEFC
jgi:hypothetical protein